MSNTRYVHVLYATKLSVELAAVRYSKLLILKWRLISILDLLYDYLGPYSSYNKSKMMVFITVQNVAGIDTAIFLKTRKF